MFTVFRIGDSELFTTDSYRLCGTKKDRHYIKVHNDVLNLLLIRLGLALIEIPLLFFHPGSQILPVQRCSDLFDLLSLVQSIHVYHLNANHSHLEMHDTERFTSNHFNNCDWLEFNGILDPPMAIAKLEQVDLLSKIHEIWSLFSKQSMFY